jgi:iron(III) transport system ATP-binding protein
VPLPISIQALSKHYKPLPGAGSSATRAVDAVTLDIAPGELFFLLGPSGCGKTTLLRMIAGFIKPTSGTLRFGDRDVTHLAPAKRNTGMVFQSYALWPHMTVAQNVAFGLSVRKVPKADREARALEALRAVRMEELARRKPIQLSGGQQQRVALARALVIKPDVLLLDEPLSNLDAKLRLEMRSEIKRICAETKITTIYVTHDQKEALSMADRIAVMSKGKLVQAGAPRDLYTRPHSRFVADFLGEANFIKAQVLSRDGDTVRLQTAAGPLEARANGQSIPTTGPVLCSIRPEALRVSGAVESRNILSTKHLETMYLGDTVQHTLALPDGTHLRIARMNASDNHVVGTPITVAVAPEDVVVLADE